MPVQTTIIQTKNLRKVYKNGNVETPALKNIYLTVKEGEFLAIMGSSGCGKSTLLNILGLLDNITSGDYHFLGKNVSGFSESERSKLRKGNIGFVYQNFNLIEELSVAENIALPLLYLRTPQNEKITKIKKILDYMQITELMDRLPFKLSGGEQQRVAMARAVVFNPKLILADEPTGNLDSENSHNIMRLLTLLNGDGKTIILVTHDEEYAKYAHRIVKIKDGVISN